jgi:hypothetical protein
MKKIHRNGTAINMPPQTRGKPKCIGQCESHISTCAIKDKFISHNTRKLSNGSYHKIAEVRTDSPEP